MSTKRSLRMLRDSTKTIGRTWQIPLGEPRSSATKERDRTGRVTSRKERCGVAEAGKVKVFMVARHAHAQNPARATVRPCSCPWLQVPHCRTHRGVAAPR